MDKENKIKKDFYKTIGILIKELRKEKSLTQQDLADILECERSSISQYESGSKKISFFDICKLCHYLNIEVNHFTSFLGFSGTKSLEHYLRKKRINKLENQLFKLKREDLKCTGKASTIAGKENCMKLNEMVYE